jgi:phosphoenolpyruvate synthase/pyruvate phosphate dikinase
MSKAPKAFLSLPTLSLQVSKALSKKLKKFSLKDIKTLSSCSKTAKKLADEVKLNTRQRNAIPEAIDALCQQYAYAGISEINEHGWLKIRKEF